MNLGLRHFRAVVAVTSTRSFSQAAVRLNVVPSALTETIRQVEKATGVALFDRKTRPVSLTQAGEDFAVTAGRIVADFDGAVRDLRRVGGLELGSIRAGAAPSVALFHLTPAVTSFHQSYPEIEVTVFEDVAERLGAMVLDRTLDFAVAERWHETEQLAYEPFCKDPFVLVCHRSHAFAQRTKVGLAEISADQLIGLDSQTGTAKLLENTPGLPPALTGGRLRAHGTIAQLMMISQGMGVALMPKMASAVLQSPRVRSIPISDLSLERSIYLVRLARAALSPAASQLMVEIRKTVSPRRL